MRPPGPARSTGWGKVPLLAGAGLRVRPQSQPAAAVVDMREGGRFVVALQDCPVGQTVSLARPLDIKGELVTHATVLRDFKTASSAKLVQLHPKGARYVLKFQDMMQEFAVSCAVRHMNDRWCRRGLRACGVPIEAVTYNIIPLGQEAGLVEYIPNSRTLCELAEGITYGSRHLRVHWALKGDAARLNKLAATTAAHLTMGYVLGLRDGHDDNIMLRSDGALFRVDYGFVFGRSPELDTPLTFVPHAVVVALGDHRWGEVVATCGHAIRALSCDDGSPPGWDLLRNVPELLPLMPEALLYARNLSYESFGTEVRNADQWTFSRAAKNTLREAVRLVTQDADNVGHPERRRQARPEVRATANQPGQTDSLWSWLW